MNFSAVDHRHMAEALRLAARGLYTTQPNPRVGCVIASGEQVLGRGFHVRAGEPHAEVFALREAGDAARAATAYVTLEPCAHHGRTGPCADALIAAGVARVVAAVGDPFDRVAGEGFAKLRAAGIVVEVGLMAAAARALNVGFFARIERGRPFVRIKLAATLDGRTALANGASRWITAEPARRDGHRLRARASAILTGAGTVLADDPQLNVRLDLAHVAPLRVIADTRLRTPPTARMLHDGGAPVLICGAPDADHGKRDALLAQGAEVIALPVSDGRIDLHELLRELARRQVNELHVESGAELAAGLVRADLVDEFVLYQANSMFGADARPLVAIDGLTEVAARQQWLAVDERRVGPDRRLVLQPERKD